MSKKKKGNKKYKETKILNKEIDTAEIPNEQEENNDNAEENNITKSYDEDKHSLENEEISQELLATLGLKNDIKALEPKHVKVIVITALKILLPVAALAIVIAILFSFTNTKKTKEIEDVSIMVEESEQIAGTVTLPEEPLEENADEKVNTLMNSFYSALAEGDIETIKLLKDYNDDTELITYEKKSEFIESYNNIICHTKKGIEENSYFVYVSYEVKIKDIETKAPGLNAFYVYTNDNGNLVIDGNMEENIEAALKLVTSQDDVVDLYTKIDVNYNEAISADEALNTFMTELPTKIKTSVGEALAQLEVQQAAETATDNEVAASEEIIQNELVKQIVKATDTVNVRSSDSEEADKIGRVVTGTELERIEIKINGWSKVIYEGKEAYIKSDYLEVVSEETVSADNASAENPVNVGDTVTATTNVNVRNDASQNADAIGTAQANSSYKLLENLGDWYKIDYNGQTGYVKAEYFK